MAGGSFGDANDRPSRATSARIAWNAIRRRVAAPARPSRVDRAPRQPCVDSPQPTRTDLASLELHPQHGTRGRSVSSRQATRVTFGLAPSVPAHARCWCPQSTQRRPQRLDELARLRRFPRTRAAPAPALQHRGEPARAASRGEGAAPPAPACATASTSQRRKCPARRASSSDPRRLQRPLERGGREDAREERRRRAREGGCARAPEVAHARGELAALLHLVQRCEVLVVAAHEHERAGQPLGAARVGAELGSTRALLTLAQRRLGAPRTSRDRPPRWPAPASGHAPAPARAARPRRARTARGCPRLQRRGAWFRPT